MAYTQRVKAHKHGQRAHSVVPSGSRATTLSVRAVRAFQKKIRGYYAQSGRDFVWRRTQNPYHILVSEIMLQQTGVSRVEKKFPEFIRAFPNFQTLARAPLARVVGVWQGMGYNRRVLALKKIAELVMKEFKGNLPKDIEALDALPGIGAHTAGSIRAFAFNLPAVFLETNIRAVYIHEFFSSNTRVHDRALLPHIEQTLDNDNPRMWYYALMDYGAHLKKTTVNPSRQSLHHHTQSKFEGSHRQVRGMVLRALLQHGRMAEGGITARVKAVPVRIRTALQELTKEGFIRQTKGVWRMV